MLFAKLALFEIWDDYCQLEDMHFVRYLIHCNLPSHMQCTLVEKLVHYHQSKRNHCCLYFQTFIIFVVNFNFFSGSWYNCQTGKKLSNTNPEHYYLNIPILTLTFDLVSQATSKLKCRHQKVCLLGVISLFYSDCICNFVVFNGCVHQSYWD